jgi:hypothetical protein
MRAVLRCIALLFCTVLFFACASAPYRTNLQLNPEAGKLSFSGQDLDRVYNTAVATGMELGFRVVSSSKEERLVTLNRLRSADQVAETLEVSVQSNGPSADVGIVYQSPKPLWDVTVTGFTDRFRAKFKAESSAGPGGRSSSAESTGVDADSRPISQRKETYLILLKNSNIRKEPSTKSTIVTTLRRGEKVLKVDESHGWYNVRLPSGEAGWVSKRLAKETE